MKNLIFVLIGFIVLAGCQPKDKTQKAEVAGKYSLELPEFLTKTSGLNQDATLEYQNLEKEFYIIVIDEPIGEFNKAIQESEIADLYSPDLTGYSLYVSDVFLETVDIISETPLTDVTINGLKGKHMEIEGSVGGVDVFYFYTMVQGAKDYYQVLTWTLLSKKEEHKEEMQKIVNSFKEN